MKSKINVKFEIHTSNNKMVRRKILPMNVIKVSMHSEFVFSS